jgi:hypothetical protein
MTRPAMPRVRRLGPYLYRVIKEGVPFYFTNRRAAISKARGQLLIGTKGE